MPISCFGCALADSLPLCHKQSLIIRRKLKWHSESGLQGISTYADEVIFSTAIILCNHYLLQNDKLNQKGCLLPVLKGSLIGIGMSF